MDSKIKELFMTGRFRPTHRVGSGRWTAYYTSRGWEKNYKNEIACLKNMGLQVNKDYVVGNDAPRGGKQGDYVALLLSGRQMIADWYVIKFMPKGV